MSTNLQIITDALRLINVIDETETPSAEQGTACLRALNQMMEQWEEDQVRLQYFEQSSTAGTFPCPAYSEPGVIAALALRVAPLYGAQVPPGVITMYDIGYSTILRKAIQRGAREAQMTHLPVPHGHSSDIINDP